MNMNLQFFADEEITDSSESICEENPVIAEQEETVNADVEETAEETEAVEARNREKDAIYAEARRTFEANAKREQERVDAEYVRRFGNYTNPETGQPIRSQADYFEALDAQQRLQQRQELESKGIDPQMLNDIIVNNPVIRQANEIIENGKRAETMKMISADVAELSQLNPNIKSLSDVPQDVVEKCREIPGLRLPDAYKLLNYGTVTAEKANAIRQGTINSLNGKAHLKPVNGVAVDDGMVDIPSEAISTWRKFYPDLSESELRKKYNSVI